MTSEERAEKKRVEKRLEIAITMFRAAHDVWSKSGYKTDHSSIAHRVSVLADRVERISSTLRGYD